MADLETANEEVLLDALSSAGVLVNGQATDVSRQAGLPADILRTMGVQNLRRLLESGASIPAHQQGTPSSIGPNGAGNSPKQNVLNAARAIQGGTITDVSQIHSLESLMMLTAGYETNMNGIIDGNEAAYLQSFIDNLSAENVDLTAVYNENAQIREEARLEAEAAAEAAALAAEQQAEINAQVSAGLVYSGFLDAGDINDPNAVAVAYNNMLLEHRDDPGFNIVNEQIESFVDHRNGDWTPTEHAVTLVRDLNEDAMLPEDFADHLESGNPDLISLAQNYMNLNGAELDVNGKTDTATVNTAQDMIDAPLTMPEGLENDYGRILSMAASGQLRLPSTPEELEATLSENELAYYNTLNAEADREVGIDILSKEQFLATTLIDGDPSRYEQFLATLNEGPQQTLDVQVELATVSEETLADILPDTPEAQIIAAAYTEVVADPNAQDVDVNAIINNPFAVEATDTTVIGGDSYLSDTLDNEAIARTEENRMIFTDQYLVADTVAQAIMASADANGGTITMGQALGVYYDIERNQHESFLEGATGSTARPSPQEGDYVATKLGFDRGFEFDAHNPAHLQAVMTGTLAYANRYDIEGDAHYIDNFLAQQEAGNPTIVALNTDITMVAEARINGGALPENTQFAVTHGIVPETIQVAEEPAIEAPEIEDPDVAAHYGRDWNEVLSPENMPNLTPVAAGFPLGGLFEQHLPPGTPTPVSTMTGHFSSTAGAAYGQDAALDNVSQANPDIFNPGAEQPRQSTINPGLNLGF